LLMEHDTEEPVLEPDRVPEMLDMFEPDEMPDPADALEASAASAASAATEASEATDTSEADDADYPDDASGNDARSAERRQETGEPRVDEALRRLDELADLAVSEHPAVFEHVHAALSDVLGELDTGSPAGAQGRQGS
jgi:hypothetical protein